MTPRRLPVVPTLVAAYRDWARMMMTMRAITLSAMLIVTAIAVGEDLVPQRLWDQQLAGAALGLVQNAIWAFLLAPVVIALHRFVILGEITPAYAFPIAEPIFRVFLGWLFALKVLAGLPFELLSALQALGWSPAASTSAFAVAVVAATFVSLRLSILLPACAVEAPGATPSRALADTRGAALRILVLVLLALAPWLAVDIAGVLLLGPGAQVAGTSRAMIFLVMAGVLQTITLSLTTVIASYAFVALAAQVKRPAARRAG